MPWLDAEYGLVKEDFVEITILGTKEVPVIPIVDQFANYINVESVSLEHVARIGTRAFKNCTSLVSVTADDDLKVMEEEAFMNTSITDFDFSSVTTINQRAFANTQLGEITLRRSVKTIAEEAFAGCDALTICCYKGSAAHQYAVDEDIRYILIEDAPPSPITLLAMEILCTEYPDQYKHDGHTTNLIGKNIGDILDDKDHTWFGNSSLDAGHNNTIEGWTKRQLYEQELRNWTITNCYKNHNEGFYAITMECADTEAKVFVIRNSDDMISWDTFKSLNYDKMAYELHSLGTDWIGNDFPLYFGQETGAQLSVASNYLEEYMQSLDDDNPDLYITGHSLGAGLTVYLSCKYDLPGTAFDAVPMLDAAYYRHPREMGRNYRGHDKWKYVDYINENDALAGLWECRFENYVSCPNLNSSGDWMQAHAPETLLFENNNHIIIPERETHTVKYLYYMKKCMGVQELSYKGGPGDKYGYFNIPTLTNTFVDWLSSEDNTVSFPKGWHTVYCGDGNDIVTASGSDKKVFIGGRGDDTLTGGSGMDHYYYYKGDGLDTIIDVGGNDQIRIFDFGAGTDFQVKNKNGSNYISIYADNEPIINISKNRSGGLYSTDQITVNIYNENDYITDSLTLRDDNNWFKDWKKYQHITVGCPVELDVYQVNPDGEDEIVLTITDASEPVTETDYGFFYNIPEYDDEGIGTGEYEKQALLFDTDNYYVAARATDGGTADFSVEWKDDAAIHTSTLSGFEIQESGTYKLDFTEMPKLISVGSGEETIMEDRTEVQVVSIDIEEDSLSLGEGDSTLIHTTYITNPEGETAELIWESSDPAVAEVSEDGTVYANSAGTCVITVTDKTGSVEASITVTVTEESAASVTLNQTEAEVKTEDTLQLEASIEPENAAGRKIIWTSSNPGVASVDENGLVTARTYGQATITAALENGESTASCRIQTRYYDVAESGSYWFKPVYWAADNSITKGYGNVYFGPEENCTREQMITFLYRAAGSPAVTGAVSFSDVEKGSYYYNAVLWAYKNGITKGYSSGPYKGKFGVSLPVTREDTVTFIYRMAGKPEYSTPKSFSDVKKGKYYYDPVLWAAQNGITNGYSSGPHAGKFGVGFDVLRKDIVTFLYRYANL